jgi:hypothetical protein
MQRHYEKKSPYENETFLDLSDVSEELAEHPLPDSSFFISKDNFIFKVTELASFINTTTHGVYKNPYTTKLFSDDDIKELKRLFANQNIKIVDLETQKKANISDQTAIEVARVAIAFSKDYETGVYKAGTLALSRFIDYYSKLAAEEKDALDNLLVEWTRPNEKTRHRTPTVTKFSDMLDEVNEETICIHLAGVYFWFAALKINKNHVLNVFGEQEKIKFTSSYWGGMEAQATTTPDKTTQGKASDTPPKTAAARQPRKQADTQIPQTRKIELPATTVTPSQPKFRLFVPPVNVTELPEASDDSLKTVMAFKKIYQALYAGQSGPKTANFLKGKEHFSTYDWMREIQTKIRHNPKGRTAIAFELAGKHKNNCSENNIDLFFSIYQYAFEHSWFKCSNFFTQRFFNSKNLKEKISGLTKSYKDAIADIFRSTTPDHHGERRTSRIRFALK